MRGRGTAATGGAAHHGEATVHEEHEVAGLQQERRVDVQRGRRRQAWAGHSSSAPTGRSQLPKLAAANETPRLSAGWVPYGCAVMQSEARSSGRHLGSCPTSPASAVPTTWRLLPARGTRPAEPDVRHGSHTLRCAPVRQMKRLPAAQSPSIEPLFPLHNKALSLALVCQRAP